MTAAILAAHVGLVWALLQVREVRDAAREVAPMFVDLIAPPAPPAPPVPPPPVPQPIPKRMAPAPVVVAAPSPAPSTFTVPEQPAPLVQAPAPAAIVAPPAPAPVAPTPQPRVIPASEVEYLERPSADYPRLSVRNNETGRVIVLVLIDERGLPQQVQIAKSSGFVRLDNSALAAIRQSRFKPPTENGRPTSGWTNVPFDFGLEK